METCWNIVVPILHNIFDLEKNEKGVVFWGKRWSVFLKCE